MRRSARAAAALTALALAPVPASAQEGEACLSFATALRQALVGDPRIESASAQADQAFANLQAANAQDRPNVALFGQTGLYDTLPLDRTRNDQLGVQVTQELYSFGQRAASKAQAAAQAQAARYGVDASRQDVAEGVAAAYLEALRTAAVAELTTEQEASFARDADLAQSRLDRRVITLTDASQIRARYAFAQSDTLTARADAEAALVRLTVLADLPRVPCVTEESAAALLGREADAVLALTVQAATDRASDRSYSLKAARAGVRAAAAGMDEARRANLPRVGVNAFTVYSDRQENFFTPSEFGADSQVSFTLRQDLYAGGRNAARRADARARLRGARADVDLERFVIEDRVGRALARARAARASSGALAEASQEGRTRLDATQREYELGTKTLTDLVIANEAYFNAARQEANARYAYYSALVSLYAALGILTDPIGLL